MSQTVAQVMKAANQKPPSEHVIMMNGGLNLASSALAVKDGQCIDLHNYEHDSFGLYRSLTGFERFDGRPAPSEALPPNPPYQDDAAELEDLLLEREVRRSAIEQVPGSGPVRGVFYLNGRGFAFRDSADGLSCLLYGSTANGWELIPTPARQPGGKYQIKFLRFPERPGLEVVGVDEVNKGFLFDGTTFTEIDNTGMGADDKPIAVEPLSSDILLLAYTGGSLQYSQLGKPNGWDGTAGAGEILLADEIQEIVSQVNDSCAILCRNRTYILYGRVPSEFKLTPLDSDTGVVKGTVQKIGDSMYVDDRGLTMLGRVQEFGNFASSAISQLAEPIIREYRQRITCSTLVREKNQYRLFFDDGTGLLCTVNADKTVAFSTFDMGVDPSRIVRCAFGTEDEDGNEVILVGADDGFVYRLERGTSFDGSPINTIIRTTFSTFGAELIGINKRVTRATLEVRATNEVELTVMPDYNYSSSRIPEHRAETTFVVGGVGYWSQAVFNESYWSTASTYIAPIYTRGIGENVSLFVRTSSIQASPHVIASVMFRYISLARRR